MENNTVTNLKPETANHFTTKDAERDFAYQAWLEDKACAKKDAADKARKEADETTIAESNQRIAEAVYAHQQDRTVGALRAGLAAAAVVGGLAAVIAFNVAMLKSAYSKK